ncbi:MAG: hydrogenase nickel incorporation protein HypB [Verrucomicrobia bacterium]|nr:hydrogenase nickel incorporation protein HypB [Verrucomicrobiota bacterium]
MCAECGCGLGGEVTIGGKPGSQVASPLIGAAAGAGAGEAPEGAGIESGAAHDHDHDSPHDPSHPHPATPHEAPAQAVHEVAVHQAILARNDRLAERNRGYFRAKGLLALNVLSSPGSGKTTLIRKTAELLGGRLRVGVIVGDLATDNDAARLREANVPVVQITTGTVCHLEAEMVARATSQLDVDALDVLIIENVGNLVCPALYDLGEDLRVVLLSVTEGEDKPLKYPPLFHSAHVALVTKSDLSTAAGFERDRALANLRRISHHARVFEVSARTGDGMEAWCEYLAGQHRMRSPNAG